MVFGGLAPAIGVTEQLPEQAELEIAPLQEASLIRPIADQTARIIEATRDNDGNIAAGVDWGNEPVVITIGYRYDSPWCYDGVEFDVDIAMEDLLDYTFTGVNGNILMLVPRDIAGHTDVTVTATEGNTISTETFRVTINRYADTGEYEWNELAIHGAGAVSGYVFHPHVEGILYAVTDVGGTWRFVFEYDEDGRAIGGHWYDITKFQYDILGNAGVNHNAPRMVGIDPTPGRENWVYMVYGGAGNLVRSTDRGDTWTRVVVRNADDTAYIPVAIGISGAGNAGNWRSSGGNNFVIVPNRTPGTPANSALGLPAGYSQPTIYALSSVQNGGIRKSTDDGLTWTGANAGEIGAGFPAGTIPGTQWIHFDYCIDNPDFRIATNGAGLNEAHGGAWITVDGGENWARLEGMPTSGTGNNQIFPQLSAARANFSLPLPANHPTAPGGRHIFVTFTSRTSANSGGNDGQRGDGAVFRWTITAQGAFVGYAPGVTDTGGVNITPQMWLGVPVNASNRGLLGELHFHTGVGFIGNTVCRTTGALVVGTHNTDPYDFDIGLTNRGHEAMFRSLDHGETWFPVLGGFEIFGDMAMGELSGLASPAANGPIQTNKWDEGPYHRMATTQRGTEIRHEPWTFMHWNFSPQINPHNPDNIFINSGLGTYVAYNLTALDARAADGAVPNVRNYKGISLADARDGLFTARQTATGGESNLREGLRITVDPRGVNPNRRVLDEYNAFRMFNPQMSPNGERTRADMVRWETAPGLFMTVQKSFLHSPATGDAIIFANTADYPGFRFTDVDDVPWSGYSWGQWIDPVWNYVYDGVGYNPLTPGDANFSGHAFDWQAHTDNTHPDLLPPRPTGLEDATIWAPTYRGIFGNNTSFADLNPGVVVSTQRMDWHSMTRGGGIISFDNGISWHLLPTNNPTRHPSAPGGGADGHWDLLTSHPASHLLGIIPNDQMPTERTAAGVAWASGGTGTSGRNVGYIILGADGNTVFWASPGWEAPFVGNAQQMQLRDWLFTTVEDLLDRTPVGTGVDPDGVLLRTNPWQQPRIWADAAGTMQIPGTTVIRFEPDPVCGETFYAFAATAGEAALNNLWVSQDGGANFYPVDLELNGFVFTNMLQDMGGASGQHHGAGRIVRRQVGQFGSFMICGQYSWFSMVFDADTNTATFEQILGNTAETASYDGFRFNVGAGAALGNNRHARGGVGLGPNTTNDFLASGFISSINDALFAHGMKPVVAGDASTGMGIYRSLDGGETWTKISPSAVNSANNVWPNGIPVAQGGTGELVNANRPFTAVNGLTGDPRVFGRVFVSQGDAAGGITAGDIVTTLLEDGDEYVNLLFYIDEERFYHIHAPIDPETGGAIVEAPDVLDADVPDDYVFIGWFTADSEPFDFSELVTANAILYAYWGHEVTVTFRGENGLPAAQTAIVHIRAAQFEYVTYYADAFDAIEEPGRAGHVFQGWFADQTGGVQILPTTQITNTEDHALYARWSELHLAFVIGNERGYFMPSENATRAHVATILARVKLLEFEHGIEELPEGMETFDAFSDVNEGDWFYYYIAWAYDAGLVEGFDGYFRPDDYITREELAAIMVRTLDEYEEMAGELLFDDADLISDWARHYVYAAFNEGLVIGDGSGNFNPLGYSIRAYVATIANRVLGRIDSWDALEAAEVENEPYAFHFPDVSETAWYFPSILAAANNHRLTRDDDNMIDWKYIIRPTTP